MRYAMALVTVAATMGACRTSETAPDGLTLEVYDVRDLAAGPPQDFPGTEIRLEEAPAPTVDAPPAEPVDMLAAVRGLPGLDWTPPRTIESTNGTLVVRQDPAGQARIREWLQARRAEIGRLVAVEAYFLARPGTSPTGEAGLRPLAAAEGEALLADARRDTGATLVCAPRLTLFDGQRGNIQLLNQISYVSGYEAEVFPHGAAGAPEPVVKIAQEGQILEVRGAIGEDGRVVLEVDSQLARILKPISSSQTPEGVVQRPDVRVQRASGSARLPDGGWALLPGLQEIGDAGPTGRRVDVLLRARVLDLTRE